MRVIPLIDSVIIRKLGRPIVDICVDLSGAKRVLELRFQLLVSI